jgi:CsoR family transcriptional regulator, copper-sensing transcriptional repressor
MTPAKVTASKQSAGSRRYADSPPQSRGAACGCEMHSRPRKAARVSPEIKSANLKRLKRIEGQVRGLARMVEEDRYCPDIMVQISSVQEALRAVGRGLMRNHLRHCASQAIRDGNPAKAEATYDELMKLIYTHAR